MSDKPTGWKCDTCEMREYLRVPNPNYSSLQITRNQWIQLRKAAEAFDRAASNRDEDEGSSGAGDGLSLWPAQSFVDWIRPDLVGEGVENYSVEGSPGRNIDGSLPVAGNQAVARHPFPLPLGSSGTRSHRGRGAA